MLRDAFLASTVLLACACASYQAQALDPTGTRAAFEARTLADPELIEFARARTSEAFPPERWDLDALTLVAFYAHPDLAAARSRIAVARAAAVRAGERPNPSLGFDPEYVTNAKSGVEPWVLGFHLSIPIEPGEKRDLRIEGARREVELAELDVEAAAWHVRSELRAAYVEHALARAELDAAQSALELQRRVLAALHSRFEAGEVSQPDVAAGEIELAQSELELVGIETRLRNAHARLALAVGVPEAALEGVELGAMDIGAPAPDVARARDIALLGSTALRRARVEYELAETKLHAAVAAQYPDIVIAPGYTWDQGDHKFAFGAAFELPLFHTQHNAIAEADAERSAARERFAAAQARALGEVDRALAAHRGALAELARAIELEQQGNQRAQAEQRAFDAGASDRLALTQAQLQAALLERARLAALGRVSDAQGALEDVLQRPLESSEEQRP